MGKRILINGVIMFWAIAAGVFVSLKPWHVYQKQNEEAKQRVKDMEKAESVRDQLLSKEAREQSSIGREERVRKAGYLGPGEVASDQDKK
jgi:hypothetical protein